jgi:hypothetical protein
MVRILQKLTWLSAETSSEEYENYEAQQGYRRPHQPQMLFAGLHVARLSLNGL